MRIIVISTSFPTKEDGSEAAGSFVKDFVEELNNQGHDVAVIAPAIKVPTENNKTKIKYYWFSVPALPLSLLSPKNPKDWMPIISTLSQGKKAVDNAVKEFKPDYIFALWALPSGHWARYAKKRYGVAYSIWALGSDIWSLGKVPVVKNYLKLVLQDATHLFADGYQLADDVKKISAKTCEFLPSTRQLPVCGLPLTKTEASYRFCFLGRWHPNKGIDLLLEALHLLDRADWDKIEAVHIAGGGAMEMLVEEQVAKLRERDCPVILSEFLDKQGVAELLVWTDYVIIPSRIESIPVIFSDALQAMRAVIVTPVGDLPKLIDDHECGILTGGINASYIAEAISNELLSVNSNFNQGIINAKQVFKLEAIVRKFVDSVFTTSR